MVMVDWYSNPHGCRPAVVCARCGTYGSLRVEDGLFVCRSELRCKYIQAYGEEK
jgi:hypothetical protein